MDAGWYMTRSYNMLTIRAIEIYRRGKWGIAQLGGGAASLGGQRANTFADIVGQPGWRQHRGTPLASVPVASH